MIETELITKFEIQKWKHTRRIQRKNIHKLFQWAESYVNLNPKTTPEATEIEASCVWNLRLRNKKQILW